MIFGKKFARSNDAGENSREFDAGAEITFLVKDIPSVADGVTDAFETFGEFLARAVSTAKSANQCLILGLEM